MVGCLGAAAATFAAQAAQGPFAACFCREGVEGSPDILEIDLQAGHVVALTKRCHPKVELHFGYLQLAHEDSLPATELYLGASVAWQS